MNGYNLTDRQKELLRKLVKHLKEGKLKEPIPTVGSHRGPFIPFRGGGSLEHQGDLIGDLNALYRAGLMSLRVERGTRVYNIEPAGYDAVDNDFEVPMKQITEVEEEKAHLEELLKIHQRNLRELRKRQAQYTTLDTPIHVLNQLEYEQAALANVEQGLSALLQETQPPEGGVIEIGPTSSSAVAIPTITPVPDSRSALSDQLGGIEKAIAEIDAKLEHIIVPQAATPSIFGHIKVQPEEDLCFVLMPFENDMLQQVYEVHIKPTVEGVGLRCERADDIYGPAVVMEDIWRAINGARVVLAELTGQNPNVFYELGLCHAIERDAILMAQDIKDVPFDVRHRRTIIYEPTPRGCKELEEVLRKTLEAALGKVPAE